MNILMNQKNAATRGRLLVTVSSIAIITSAGASNSAFAGDARPTLWLELGVSVENVGASVKGAALPFGPMVSSLTAPLSANLSFGHSNSGEGKITFRPEDSDWEFSASIRFGRATGRKARINQAMAPIPTTSFTSYKFTYPLYPSSNKIRMHSAPVRTEKLSENSITGESHLILDFAAGKDVGLGLFGRGSTSVLSAGVRFANFKMSLTSKLHETNGIHFTSSTFRTYVWPGYGTSRRELWDVVSANGSMTQSFRGLGPSVKWDASVTLWGDAHDGELSLDWGANAALLFGRQTKEIVHQSTAAYQCAGSNCPSRPPGASNGLVRTSRNIIVPNIGGFAGISIHYADAKVSLGYRADEFFNAIDGGRDPAKKYNRGFEGPYLNMSIGFGD